MPMAFLERPQCLGGFLFLVAVVAVILLEVLMALRVLLAVEVAKVVLVDLECLETLVGQANWGAVLLTGLAVAVVVLALLAQMLRPQSVVLAVQG